MPPSSAELILRFTGDKRHLEQTLAQVRLDLSRSAQAQTATTRQETQAVISLQRQRSTALIAQWRQEEREAAKSAHARTQEETRAVRTAESLQRQRSAALIAQWKHEERESARSAQVRLREESRALRQKIAEEKRIEREAAAASASLQRQRSAALIAQWKHEQRERVRIERETAQEVQRSLAQLQQPGGLSGRGSLIAGAVGGLTALIGLNVANEIRQAGQAWLHYASNLETTRVAFATMLGSAEAAQEHLQELQRFALTTPFQFPDLIAASQRMQALGFAANQVVPILNDVGNAVAAAGGGSERLDRVTLALSQIQSKGKVMTQELNQLAESGIPAFKILQEALGKSRAEITKLVEQGKISSEFFLDAFQKFSQANFGGLMEQQSRTFSGAMSNINEALLHTANIAFQPLFVKISEITDTMAQEFQRGKPDLDASFRILVGGLIEIAGAAGGSIADALINKITDPRRWAIAQEDPFFVNRLFRGLFSTLGDPEDLFGLGDNFNIPAIKIPDLKPLAALTNQQNEVSEATKKAAELVDDLSLKLTFYGQNTEKAATQQKLLQLGMEALTSAEGRRAVQLAELIDKQRILSDLTEQQRKFEERLATITEGKYKNAFESLLGVQDEARIAMLDLAAAHRGGLDALERFNLGLGAQVQGMLTTAQASAFTAEQVGILGTALQNARTAMAELTLAHKEQQRQAEKKQAIELLTQFIKQQTETLRELRSGARTALQEAEEFITQFPKLTGAMTETDKFSDSFWLKFTAHIIDSIRRMKELIELMRDSVNLIPAPGGRVPTGPIVPSTIGAPPPETLQAQIDGALRAQGAFAGLGVAISDALGQGRETAIAFAETITESFGLMASAVGDAVRAFLLFGSAQGSFRKFAAEVIASIAQMAVVQAIWETAQALAMMALTWFTGNPKYAKSAGAHWAAAATYGLIAAAAVPAARLTAGDEFSRGTGSGGGGGTSSAGGTTTTTGQPQTVELDRATRNQQAIAVNLNVNVSRDAGSIVEVTLDDHRNNGPIRQMILSELKG